MKNKIGVRGLITTYRQNYYMQGQKKDNYSN